MNIEEYINDPSVAPQTNRDTKTMYMNKLNEIILRENKMPDVAVYVNKDEYWFYVSVPDAKVHGIYYDVVLQFKPKSAAQLENKTIKAYDVKFFANDPGFIFYFAYVFNKESMIISSLKHKLNTLALTKAPEKTNPELNIRYCKTIYFAYLIIEKLNLYDKEYINMRRPGKLNLAMLSAKIKSDTHIRAKIDTNRKIKRVGKKINKTLSQAPTTIKKTIDNIVKSASISKTTNVSKTSKSSSRSKTARTIGSTKTQRTVGKTRKH